MKQIDSQLIIQKKKQSTYHLIMKMTVAHSPIRPRLSGLKRIEKQPPLYKKVSGRLGRSRNSWADCDGGYGLVYFSCCFTFTEAEENGWSVKKKKKKEETADQSRNTESTWQWKKTKSRPQELKGDLGPRLHTFKVCWQFTLKPLSVLHTFTPP